MDDIDTKATSRERIVAAVSGDPDGETLLRRAAHIADRSGRGEFMAVHVSSQDDARAAAPADLAAQQALVESLGGTYHQVIGEDIAQAVIEFAGAHEATQLVIGESRRGRIAAVLSGPGIGATVVRDSGDLDVHIVSHPASRDRPALPRITGGALSRQRVALGFVVALVGGPLLTWLLYSARTPESITSDVLAFQLLVVIVALVGGIWPALFAAVLSGLTLDFLFVAPQFTVEVSDPLHLWALFLYVLIALLVSYIVDQAARRARTAQRATAEAELLATVAGNVLRGESAVPALVSRAREAFGLAGVRLLDVDGTVKATDGEPVRDGRFVAVPIGTRGAPPRATLELHGQELDASERRLLDVIVAQLGAALERAELTETARAAEALAAADQVRSALLSAVSHDVRRPLAAAIAAVGGLRASGPHLSDADRQELVETADESLAALSKLVTDLLDVSRVEAGVLTASTRAVDAADVVLSALEELGLGPDVVDLALDPDLPAISADPVLLQRVLVNVLANAERHAPHGTLVKVTTGARRGRATLRVIDHGAGIAPERRDEMFAPFQRLGDTDNTSGLGLGLALSKGFTEGMGGTLTPEDTPGGGLTMVIELPIAEVET
ncbi:two-component system, OmpR family, sensor histidine kinase KdpD [Microbacterium sp. cf046]|nr:two-component system, OmpR family, sensor histidine kinase KdpD [Microbacterium sp. cf046]